MAKVDKLQLVTDFYSAQLHDLDLDTTGVGMVSYLNKDGDQKPVTISGDRLCLPTRELLKEGNWDGRVVFHPLSEQFGNSLSPVMNSFKQYVQISLTGKYAQLIVAIAELASDPSRHKKLGAKIGGILRELGEFDAKTFAAARSLVKRSMEAPETRLVNILMRSGAQDLALRSTVITHPIVEGLQEAARDGNNKFLNMSTLRKGDMTPLSNLFNLVTGGGESSLYKSDDRTAPYYHSLMQGFYDKATKLNELLELFGPKVPAIKSIKPYTLEWAELIGGMDEFAKFASKHHQVANALPGNRPVVEDDEVELPVEKVYETTAVETKPEPVERERDVRHQDRTDDEDHHGRSLKDFLGNGRRNDDSRRDRFSDRDSRDRRDERISIYDRDRRDRFSDRGITTSRSSRTMSIRDFGRPAGRDKPW